MLPKRICFCESATTLLANQMQAPLPSIFNFLRNVPGLQTYIFAPGQVSAPGFIVLFSDNTLCASCKLRVMSMLQITLAILVLHTPHTESERNGQCVAPLFYAKDHMLGPDLQTRLSQCRLYHHSGRGRGRASVFSTRPYHLSLGANTVCAALVSIFVGHLLFWVIFFSILTNVH